MIVLLHLFGALFACAAAEAGLRLDLLPAWTGPLWAFVAYPLAHHARRRLALGRRSGLAERLLGHWPALAQAGAVMVSGWLVVGRPAAPGLEQGSVFEWPGASLFAVFLPFALAVLATGDAALSRGVPRRLRLGAALHHLRTLALVFVPLGLYVLVSWPLRAEPERRALVEEVRLVEMAWTAVLVVGFGALLPFLFAAVLGLVPLGRGGLRATYDQVAARLRFRGRGPLLWPTAGNEINAAVVGFAPWHRFVMVTDGIATGLSEEEARALFGHEMGHSVLRHAWLFAAFTVAVLGPALLVAYEAEPGTLLGEVLVWWGPVVGVALWFLGFGWLSRRAELEADLVAASVAGGPEPLVRLLARTTSPRSVDRAGWRHFSPAQRALFARAAHRHQEVGLRLRRVLGRARAWSYGGAALALAVLLAAAVRGLGEDLVRLDLRRGEYAAALERGAARGELAELARVGLSVAREADGGPASAPDAAELVARAAAALEAGDLARAAALLELARWRRGGPLDAEGERVAERLRRAVDALPRDSAQ